MEEKKVEAKTKHKVKSLLGWLYFWIICGLIGVFIILPNKVLPVFYRFNEIIGIHKLSKGIFNDSISMNVDATFVALFFDFLILFIVTYALILIFKRMKWLKILLLWAGFGGILFYSYSMPLSAYYQWGSQIGSNVILTEEVQLLSTGEEQVVDLTHVDLIIPPYFGREDYTLKVDTLEYSDQTDGYAFTLMDEAGESIHMLPDYIQMTLDLTLKELEGKSYKFYDPEEDQWQDVAYYYDLDIGKTVILTNHFTEFKSFKREIIEQDELLKPLTEPTFVYKRKTGIYASDVSPEDLRQSFELIEDAKKNPKKEVTAMDSAMSTIRKVKSQYTQPELFVKLCDIGIDYADIVKAKEIDVAYFSNFNNHMLVETATEYSGQTLRNSLKGTTAGLSLASNVLGTVIIYDEFKKANYDKVIYESLKALADAGGGAISGPVGFITSCWIFTFDRFSEYDKFLTNEAIKEAYSVYYNGSDSRPESYWHFRFEEIMKKELKPDENIYHAFKLLDYEIDQYLLEFWSSENELFRDKFDLPAKISSTVQIGIQREYKHLYFRPLVMRVLDRYMNYTRMRQIEYEIFMSRLFYRDNINKIGEIEVTLDSDAYDLQKCHTQVIVNDTIIFDEAYKNKSVTFKARLYKLLPSDPNMEDKIHLRTLIVDKKGIESVKDEYIYILDMGQKLTYRYSDVISIAVKIDDRAVTLNMDEAYKFSYSYDNDGETYLIPDEVIWQADQGSIDETGLYTPAVPGVDTIRLTVNYEEGNQSYTDEVNVTVEGELEEEKSVLQDFVVKYYEHDLELFYDKLGDEANRMLHAATDNIDYGRSVMDYMFTHESELKLINEANGYKNFELALDNKTYSIYIMYYDDGSIRQVKANDNARSLSIQMDYNSEDKEERIMVAKDGVLISERPQSIVVFNYSGINLMGDPIIDTETAGTGLHYDRVEPMTMSVGKNSPGNNKFEVVTLCQVQSGNITSIGTLSGDTLSTNHYGSDGSITETLTATNVGSLGTFNANH
ncbi:hypothetical protein [Fusibacter ferrireducens]|uniref:Uncharacterized protein n=1 Tax=Fusibacter ferrireducens TaxID=2785058 RepID=A0ABR9ZYS4_9FIRM|nr:hypothetical protein [Fusibacter ferrireducens]MBF4695526.1 hypothetical protein [Fusibacter ferrireducens]